MKIFAMLLILVILATVKGDQSNSSEKCTNACPRIFSPVCAVSGGAVHDKEGGGDGALVYRYFHNDCIRRYASCSTGTVWRITSMSLCLQHVDPLVREQCLRPCPFIYEPICATNGEMKEIFGNGCVLEVENCLSIETWTLTDDSDCGL